MIKQTAAGNYQREETSDTPDPATYK